MIKTFMCILPFIILFLTAIISVSLTYDKKKSHNISLMGFILAIIVNSALLIFVQEEIAFNAFKTNPSSLRFSEIVLVALFLIFIALEHDLKETELNEYKYSNYLLFSSSIMGLFITDNLFILSIFYIMSIVFLGAVYTYGDYKKRMQSMRKYFVAFTITLSLIIISNLIINYYFETLEITKIKQIFSEQSRGLQVFFILANIFNFGFFAGIVPIAQNYLDEYFDHSNITNLKMINCIFLPISGFLIIKTTGFSIGLMKTEYIYFYFGAVGIVIMIIQTLRELFGNFKTRTKSVGKIIGYYSMTEMNVYLVLTSLKGYGIYFTSSEEIFTVLIFNLFVISVFGKILLFSGLNPVLNSTTEWDLRYLGGFQKHFPKFIGFLFIIPFLYLFPGLVGYSILSTTTSVIRAETSVMPIKVSFLWIVGFLYLCYLGITIMLQGTLLNEFYFGKPQQHNYSKKIQSVKDNLRIYYLISLMTVIILVVLSYYKPVLETNFLFS